MEWAHVYLGECLYSDRELAAMIVGYCSVFSWLFAQLPQVIKNFRRKCTSGLSVYFLILWLLGDVSNLLGCILTDQMPFQKYLAGYFIFIDFVLFWQMLFYGQTEHDNNAPEESDPLIGVHTIQRSYSLLSEQGLISTLVVASMPAANALSVGARINNNSADESFLIDTLGQIFAWASLVCYLSSRLPQIIRNYQTKSVEGLSILLFIFAIIGNSTYSISIILKSTSPDILWNSFPYLLGSAGTLLFDCIIFIQYRYYRRANHKITLRYRNA